MTLLKLNLTGLVLIATLAGTAHAAENWCKVEELSLYALAQGKNLVAEKAKAPSDRVRLTSLQIAEDEFAADASRVVAQGMYKTLLTDGSYSTYKLEIRATRPTFLSPGAISKCKLQASATQIAE